MRDATHVTRKTAKDPMVLRRELSSLSKVWIVLCIMSCCPEQTLQRVVICLVGEARGMAGEPLQPRSADRKPAYERQFERPNDYLVVPFSERVTWKDPALHLARLRRS